ncbi:MAG TPA: hypothetical protein VI006_12215 [Solirubrobacteraceae bacterium]|jgi:hypothetical protein
MSTTRRGRDAVERRERLARASAARAKRDRGVGLLLIRLGVATWVVPFLIMGPEAIGHCQFAYFDADWTPRLLGERGAPLPAGDSERAKALRCLAREFKIAWSPLWARIVVYCAASLAALAGLEALISSAS